MKYNGFIRPQSNVQRSPKRAGKSTQELMARGYSKQPERQDQWSGVVRGYDTDKGSMEVEFYRGSDA